MPKHRIRKYSRRTSSQYRKSRAPIIISVIAFLLLSVIVSVVIGIMLGKRAEDNKKETRFDFDAAEYISNGKTVSRVEAYHFPKGAGAYDYVSQDINDFSVCIRHADGSLGYHFKIGEELPFDSMDAEYSFKSVCESAHAAKARVCAYMYVTSFGIEDEYRRDIVKAYELALIKEAAESGADDILLLGIDIEAADIAEIKEFVSRAAVAAGKAPLGVMLDEDTLRLAEKDDYTAAGIRSVCDYLALDLTYMTLEDGESAGDDGDGEPLPSKLEETVDRMQYYIKTYPVRVIFSREHSKLYKPALELGIVDLQIVTE